MALLWWGFVDITNWINCLVKIFLDVILQSYLLNCLGCEQHSYGYHGQNGQLFQQGHGNPFGPAFTSPDIIGCGVNFATKSAFFTKNGVSLGVAQDIDTSELLYPCIGLSSNGEKITANFGQEPFAFDIDQYVKVQIKVLQKNKKHAILMKFFSFFARRNSKLCLFNQLMPINSKKQFRNTMQMSKMIWINSFYLIYFTKASHKPLNHS